MKLLSLIIALSFLILFLQPLLASKTDHFSIKSTNQKFLSTSTSTEATVEESEASLSSMIFGPLFGSIFFIFSLIFLWKNERGYVISCKRLNTELEVCGALDPNTYSQEHDGNLVYLEASTSCDENINDKDFTGIGTFNAVKLIKTVEMHQWKENKRKEDRREYYDYEMTWSESFIESTSFHEQSNHMNIETNFIRRSDETFSTNVHIGQYFLSDELKKMTKNRKELTITEETLKTADTKFMKDLQEIGKIMHIQGNYIYVSTNNFQHMSGDLRFSFFEVKCGPTSILAKQNGNSFTKFIIPAAIAAGEVSDDGNVNNEDVCDSRRGCCYNCWNCMCKIAGILTSPINEIFWIFEKFLGSKEAIFDEAMREQKSKRNWFRLLGWFLNVLGIYIFFSPIYYLLSWIPLVGTLLAALASWVALIFGLIFGSALCMVTIALAWLFYRPLLSLGLITVATGLAVGLSYA